MKRATGGLADDLEHFFHHKFGLPEPFAAENAALFMRDYPQDSRAGAVDLIRALLPYAEQAKAPELILAEARRFLAEQQRSEAA